MDISNRIKQKMAEHNLRAADLVRATGASKGSVSQWLHGINSPGGKYIVPLTKTLKCDSDWLFSGVGASSIEVKKSNQSLTPIQGNTKNLPIISHTQAGEWTNDVDYRTLGKEIEWEEAPDYVSDQAFWLKVTGHSMASLTGLSIGEGSLILVDPTITANNGDLVIAKIDGAPEVTFKKLVIDAAQTYLMPLNPNYRPIDLDGNYRIVGVVKEARVKL